MTAATLRVRERDMVKMEERGEKQQRCQAGGLDPLLHMVHKSCMMVLCNGIRRETGHIGGMGVCL